ncbi:FtsK/SpoIIIE domain-containing protein [Klugiella xanthotipulae]|uniref:S-DNA-T family DNA segregation ATPase FtsK/SpoIIIE n=1 Tax=Klugiella xanthotipulae TaxID=244735 RepID=A0A543I4N3_9MICO|nr:FtsK/SpoIIIE domain-containing protein [Klugiella xanthotipulae]TQM65545.1 S-DNA-T family DNA segregation ATPase FtsK/SpoIIIE [Klugiella xanthotipulae]
MRVFLELDGQPHVVEVGGWQPSATLTQFVESAGVSPLADEEQVFVDGTAHSGATPLAEVVLLEGSVISRTPPVGVHRISSWNVALSGGLAVSTVVPIPAHRRVIVGRAPQADLVLPSESASWHHCSLELEEDGVRLRDADSTNGTYVEGNAVDAEGILLTAPSTVIVGGAVLNIRPTLIEPQAPAPGSLHNLTPAATVPFNRPPRPGTPEEPDSVVPPARQDVPPASKFNFITVLVPLVMAGVMVMIMGDARFALFAALSPVMAIGMWFEQKHRRGKNLQEEEERFEAALVEFRGDIAKVAAVESLRRQDMIPDPAVVLRRPALPSTLMWQRRADSADFLALHAGVGDVPWQPEIDSRSSVRLDDKVKETLDESRLVAAPVLVDLSNAGVVGIVGDRDGALALARSLLAQAAVHCGPADLTIGIFCDKGREQEWDWASWLPHTRQAGSSEGVRWISNQREASSAMLRSLRENVNSLPTPALLVVLDSEVLTEGRDAPARELLAVGRIAPGESTRSTEKTRRVSGIVIATTADQLPSSCSTVIEVGADASATVENPENLTRVEDVILAGISPRDALTCAMTLAHFDDPEFLVPGASLPSLVRLPELLGVDTLDAAAVRGLWQTPSGMSTPIGIGESGQLSLDLVTDGPHGLVGGTTGSGKSEFLRSFVAGLAARNDPTRLNFILIDFKGGAAFKACERLPHTIGTISNLDEQLADRALRALEAEMQRRQRLFAEAGEDVDNLNAYLATNPAEPLPRLLLVIDEFAMLAKDFPDVLASLVSVGAVGRTLGVHMILATQRPAGVVNEDILANTNLRVALRVQSREDSSNVIGVPSASSIGRAQMGRAYVKLGQDDITPVQTALVTGRAQQAQSHLVEVREVGLFGVPAPLPPAPASKASDANDLDLLIDAVVGANELCGFAPPRQVWPEALGESVALDGYARVDIPDTGNELVAAPAAVPAAAVPAAAAPATGGVRNGIVTVALADEPDLQRQSAAGWDLREGNLMVMGVAGSGTTTTMSSIALALASEYSPADLDILCLDMARDLSPLAALPHTVAYVGSGSGSKEQQARFLRYLRTEFDRRREAVEPQRPAVVLIDGLAALRDEFQDFEGQQLLDILYRVYADGPSVGMSFVVSTTRVKAVPSAMDEVTTQKWLFRLADPYDYATFGVKGKSIPAQVPGRCVNTTTQLQMHIATPGRGPADAVAEAAERWAHIPPKSDAIGSLPEHVPVGELVSQLSLTGDPWRIPVGLREDTLGTAFLEVYEGEHILVAGPARSGKSTLILALAEAIRTASVEGARPAIWGIFDRRSPLANADLDRTAATAEEIPALLASLRLERGPVILLIDDGERVDDADQSIANLVATTHPGLCIIAAGRSADLRSLFSHWSKTLRKARCGVLLQPDVDYDGELLGVGLPRRAPVAITQGRGYMCVGGSATLIQSMSPTG